MSMKGKGEKGGKGGSGGKSRSGGGSVLVTKSKARETAAIDGAILTLRKALFDDEGKNRDVTEGILPAFLRYDRKGLDLRIQFTPKLRKEEVRWSFSLIKEQMEERYDESGYGWDDEDKMAALMEPEARFLVVREAQQEEEEEPAQQQEGGENAAEAGGGKKKAPRGGAMVAIVHFRFTVQGEFTDCMAGEPCLLVWDLSIDPSYQRKGLGRHLLTLLELIARKTGVRCVSLPVMLGDDVAADWLTRGSGRKFVEDEGLEDAIGFSPEAEGFRVFSKEIAIPC